MQTRLETCAVRLGGTRRPYTETISCSKAGMIPVDRNEQRAVRLRKRIQKNDEVKEYVHEEDNGQRTE